ncbi:MAG: HlyD family efflux transporter periplasmic adaptor subunit [Burkholderiaceae bacterium]
MSRTRFKRELPWFSFLSVALLAALIAAFLVWAYSAELEEVTRGQGRVVPSSREQVIQSLDPGVLTEMLVHEGQEVEKGQLLLRIDDTRASALYREMQAKSAALAASAARLRAEAYGGKLEFPRDVLAQPELVRRETEAYNARRRSLEEMISGLTNGMKLLDREVQITEPMVARGLVSEVELLRLKRQRNDLALQLADRQNKFRVEAAADLLKYESELAQSRETMLAREDAYQRTEIRSPMKGTVKSVKINTIGGVIQAGQDILLIVPSEDTLMVEAYVRPADVAFLHPGQRAVVKISAYDYAIYGGLDGVVENISPDTVRDERRAGQPVADVTDDQHSYYRVLVRTFSNALHQPDGKPLPIIPGMTASVEMLSGKKTVLHYLLKPLNRAREGLRER